MPLDEPVTPVTPRRSRVQAARRAQQQRLEAQASVPVLSQTPLQPPPAEGAWEDTSTFLDMPKQTFFSRQSPVFWIIATVLLLSLLFLVGIIGVNQWREAAEERAEQQRLQLLAEEKARYRLDYREWIEYYSINQGIDPAFVAAIIYNESRFDPNAESYLGARGLMQIMKATGGWIAEKLDEEDTYSFDLMYNPEDNIRYGTWYLGYLARLFDANIDKVAAGYHAGQNAVQSWLDNPEYSSDGRTLQVIPYQDTDQYVQRVKNAYEMYKKHYYAPEATPEPGTDNATT